MFQEKTNIHIRTYTLKQRAPKKTSGESSSKRKAREAEQAARELHQKNANYRMVMDDDEPQETEGVSREYFRYTIL